MKKELLLYRYVDGTNDTPFPSIDEQISLTTFTYNAQRMAATPTITSSFNYPRCLDNEWDVNVYAEYRGEKYYIRQIPSSSKDNKSVMYKHDITLYSERFVLENIYLYDVLKNDDTNVIIRCDLADFVKVINRSFEKSELKYSVKIDDSVANTEKALEVKDIALDKVYLSVALQEIYNQWEIPYYFDGHNIIVKDHSKWIVDTVLEYGYNKSLLSIKKENANFRKITRCSGYGSDKNIPFFYPNLSQKGIIDLEALESNKLLQKSDFVITDIRKFDKQIPLNGNVVYLLNQYNYPELFYSNSEFYKRSSFTEVNPLTIPIDFSFIVDRSSTYAEFELSLQVSEQFTVGRNRFEGNFWSNKTYDDINWNFDIKESLPSELMSVVSGVVTTNSSGGTTREQDLIFENVKNEFWHESKEDGNKIFYVITRYFKIKWAVIIGDNDEYKDKEKRYYSTLSINFNKSKAVENSITIGSCTVRETWDFRISRDENIPAENQVHSITTNFSNFISKYGGEKTEKKGWFLNKTKRIELSEIGVTFNGNEDDLKNGEGFKQVMVSKIPTATNLMPPLYRDSLGNEKFYNAKDNTYLNDDNEYYDFETEWTEVNQNEHIQPFDEIYPTITNIVNADNVPFDEILDVAFDDNDNNEVDEEGNFLHPYFYVKIAQFNGSNGFNLFDHKIVGGNMQVSFTSGDCSACLFDIMVKTRPNENNETYEDVINPIKTENGALVSGNWQQKTAGNFGSEDTTQQNSETNSIWLVLKKDDQTFGTTLPDSIGSVIPRKGDKFVLLNIEMPQKYIDSAEELLRKNIIQYMWENNSDKWNFNIDFSRIFLQENPIFVDELSENAKVRVKYNGLIYDFYVNNFIYEVKANETLPKIKIGLADTLSINKGIAQTIANGVMQNVQSQLNGVAYLGDLNGQYLRKRYDETMPNNITFEKDVKVNKILYANEILSDNIKSNNIQSENYIGDNKGGLGYKLSVDEKGESTLVVDVAKVKKKLEVDEYIINQIKAQGGTLFITSASMECNNVEDHTNYYRCFFDTRNGSVYNQFELDDLAFCKRFGSSYKYYWRKVINVNENYIDLSKTDCDSNSDIPTIGDNIIQLGNKSNKNRQSVIELSSNGDFSPSFIMYSNIDDFSLVDKQTTGIIYRKGARHIDESGNELKNIESYPEFFSYGSMYFGSRDKQSNYISFEKNEQGMYEMIINAKTTFKSGTQNISDILASIDNSANTANANAQSANNTANQTKEDLANLTVGGENLVLGAYKYPSADKSFSFTSDTNDDYNPYPELTCKLEAGQIYTFTAYTDGEWCNIETITDNSLQVDSWLTTYVNNVFSYMHMTKAKSEYNGGKTISVKKLKDGRLCAVFIPAYTHIYHVRFDIDYIGSTRRFWKVQIEKGSIPTDWKPAETDTVKPLYDAIKGSTEIEGGLISTNVLMVKNANNAIKGGISGVNDNIAFWSGGTYQDAVNGNCNVIIRKDGTAKIGSFIVKDGYVEVKLDSGGYARMNTDGIRIFDNNNIVRTKLIGGNVSNSFFESKLNAHLIQNGPYSEIFTFTKSSENSSSPGVLSMPLLKVIKNTNKLNVSVGIAFNLSSSYYNPDFQNEASLYATVELTKDGEAYRTLSGGLFTYQGGNFYNNNGDMIQYITIKRELEYQDLPLGDYGIDFKIGETSSANSPAPIGFTFSSKVSGSGSTGYGIAANLTIEDPSTIIGVNGVMTFQRTNQYFGAYTDPADNQFKIIGKGDVVNIEQN